MYSTGLASSSSIHQPWRRRQLEGLPDKKTSSNQKEVAFFFPQKPTQKHNSAESLQKVWTELLSKTAKDIMMRVGFEPTPFRTSVLLMIPWMVSP
jgi:hypothetical protein